ncbi:hypothetical protein FRB95_014349 [Tulasnella sp. JGI-2019a]|nr:hypothetical protein FRB95_014349 [Tulasnella sp. JGI-2019a]
MCIADEYDAWIKHRDDPGVLMYFSQQTWAPRRQVGLLFCELGSRRWGSRILTDSMLGLV